MKVAKFGGSSLANAEQIKKVVEIIKSDSSRRCIVVSAPGEDKHGSEKITKMLYSLAKSFHREERLPISYKIAEVYQRISDAYKLGINFHNETQNELMHSESSEDYIVSRGEYWMAKILAEIIGYTFVDARDFITFDENGMFDMQGTKRLAKVIDLKTKAEVKGVVIPGFYGALPNGRIKTFSRGGSDISGSIVAACINSDLYENWTDVSGVNKADPRIIDNPSVIQELTYQELRELAYRGANVLHDESVIPIRKLGIPINVRNTNAPEDKGTMVVNKISKRRRLPGSIIGIAGKTGFSVIRIEKVLMGNEIGFLRRVCGIMEKFGINIEHIPSGIDVLSIIIGNSEKFNLRRQAILNEIKEKCNPDNISIEKNMAVICVVGNAMKETPGVAAKIINAIANAGINIRMIDQCSSEIGITIGVNEKDYRAAVYAIYCEFVD